MAQDKKDTRIIIKGDDARAKLLEGARLVYETVSTTYGPKGRNVLAEKPFGRPVLTRDGVTVARETYFEDRAANMGAQQILEAAETTNRLAGDGTSATAILAYELMKGGAQAIAAGVHPMQIKQQLIDDSIILLEQLDSLSKPVKKGQLEQVATVSAGDPNLGKMIAEAIEKVGVDGGITAEKAPIQDIEREYVEGYYLQTGFMALQLGKKEMTSPSVIVSSKRLTSPVDGLELLNGVAKAQQLQPGQIPRVLFVGNIEDGAYNMIVDNINRGTIDAIVIKTPPQFGEMGKQLLEDIAIYCGCSPLTDSMSIKNFGTKYIGSVDRVVANRNESTLYGSNTGETIQDRVAEIKSQLEVEVSDTIAERLQDRIAKLQGKIALFRIGGTTETEKEETEFRIEDAIQATRAAAEHGIVAGGGATLLRLSVVANLSATYRNALHNVFKKLLTNADIPAEVGLEQALRSAVGSAFNLREDGELVNMVEAGILDPTLVVQEVIKNATVVAANALTTDVLLVFADKEE